MDKRMKIRKAMKNKKQRKLMIGIIECDECYIRGKKKKGDNNKKDHYDNFINTKERTSKKEVIGVVERNGKVKVTNKISLFISNKNIL